MKIYFGFIFLFFLPLNFINSQSITQNIRGTVFDNDSKITLPGANIVITDLPDIIGTTTDYNGDFVLHDILIGRHTL